MGAVAFAGSAVDLETRADPHTVRLDLEPGEIAIPGLTDAHLHLLDAALATEHVDLTTAADRSRKASSASSRGRPGAPGRRVAPGWGMGPAALGPAGRRPPTSIGPFRVVAAALWSFDHHAVWGSSASLTQAGIDAATADPPGGIIRRSADGTPGGRRPRERGPLIMGRVPAPTTRRPSSGPLARIGRQLLELGVVARS